MELEFDKEIDAILRKGRAGPGESVTATGHLDADSIAAFAENAMPQQARLAYTTHLADCGRCRKQLAFVATAPAEESTTSVAPASAPAVGITAAWYSGLFQKQNLALAMGALVVAFGGILGFIAIQNSRVDQNASVTQVTEQEQQRGGPFSHETAPMANANMAANIATPMQQAAGNTNAADSIASGMAASAASNSALSVTNSQSKPRELARLDEQAEAQAAGKLASAPPPPALTLDGDATTMTSEKKSDADDAADKEKDVSANLRKRAESRRDMPAPAAKMGPTRSGPLQDQATQNSQLNQMSVTRTAGGKTFTNRDRAWYDTAYRGQATQNFRRGTPEYRGLEAGLRSIADSIGGTVVIVWKAKAYRIQ
ncbi:MAG: hypothetical protein WKF34_06570 [Pyrinomonadaceae bacterium]